MPLDRMRGLHPPNEVTLVKYAALIVVVALAALSGCSKEEPPPAPAPAPEPPKAAPAKPAPAKPNLAPPLSDAQKAAMEKSFNAARELVKKAREFKAQGDALVKTQGIQAANDVYVKARDLYRQATETTEEWIEPELGKVTEAQVKDYLGSMLSERGTWVKENASMGKLHKD